MKKMLFVLLVFLILVPIVQAQEEELPMLVYGFVPDQTQLVWATCNDLVVAISPTMYTPNGWFYHMNIPAEYCSGTNVHFLFDYKPAVQWLLWESDVAIRVDLSTISTYFPLVAG